MGKASLCQAAALVEAVLQVSLSSEANHFHEMSPSSYAMRTARHITAQQS